MNGDVAEGGFEVHIIIGDVETGAELFELSQGCLGQVALDFGAAFALEDAAACKAEGINAAFAVDAAGADAGGHGLERCGDVMGEIQQFGSGQEEAMAEGIEVAASAAGGA